MLRAITILSLSPLWLACSPETVDYGPAELANSGAAIDSKVEPVNVSSGTDAGEGSADVKEPEFMGEYLVISVPDLDLDELGDEGREDLLDAMLFPEEYSEEDRKFPDQIQALDGKKVALRGYMLPSDQDGDDVLSFLLLGDLLACCFGGAPRSDQWVNVEMAEGKTTEYYAFVPIIVKGEFKIEVIEDEAGYPAGCYRLEAESVEKE